MKKQDFLRLFDERLFFAGLTAKSKQDALVQLVDHLHAGKRINNRQAVLTTLLEREKLGSTGLGKGIAIPHSRSNMVERMTVLFASFADPVEFEALDKKPVHLVFLILAPPQDVANEYHPFIARLVEVVKEKKNRDALKKVASHADFLIALDRAL